MDRLALMGAGFLGVMLGVYGSLAIAPLAARKGYNPRLGALFGAITGLLGSITPALIVLTIAPQQGGLVVLAALVGGAGALALLPKLVPDRDAQKGDLPDGEGLRRNIQARHTRGVIARGLFILSIVVALVALATLLWTIINKSVGLTAVQYAIEPEALTITTYDPGAWPGDLTPEQATTLLTAHVSLTRLQELVLERVIEAKPRRWDDMKTQPTGALLDGFDYPADLAATPLRDLSAAQAVDLLARNLSADALQLLAFTEAGRPLSAFSDAELIALLAANASPEQLQARIRRDLLGDDGEAGTASGAAPVEDVLIGFEYPNSAARKAFSQIAPDEAAAILVANMAREPLELLIIHQVDTRDLDDLSEYELGALVAVNVRKALLRVSILRDLLGVAQSDFASYSPQPVARALDGRDYPEAAADTPIGKLDEIQATTILALNLGSDQLKKLLVDEVIQAEVVASWPLWDSLTRRASIETEQQTGYPQAELQWRSWVNRDFLTSSLDPRKPDATGIRPALYGSLLIIAITIMVAFPVGVGAALYLEEYAGKSRINQIIQTNINNLAGVPSIVYGMLGLAIFVRSLEALTSGQAFGVASANGRTVLSAGFTLALLVLPLLIINAQEAIRAVPSSLRQASYGLGATQWQTIWNHVLPYAMPGILTGTILAISRAIGETAPLILVGGATYLTQDPDGPFSTFTALPLLIYRWTTLPQDEFRNAAAAAIVVLLVLLLGLNSLAIILRNRFSRRLS